MRDVQPPAAIGVVGLGLVGNALAHRLAGDGYDVVGYDLRPEARAAFADGRVVDALPALGAMVATVVLAVFDTRDVLRVVDGEDGLFAEGARVTTLIDCSTGDPDVLAELAARLSARGVTLIEAPLSGSSRQIRDGEATMLLGGDAAAITARAALLAVLCPRHVHVGGAGLGAKAKLATNLVLGLNRAVFAEGLAFARALGIAPQAFLDLVLASPARSVAAEIKGPMMVRDRFDDVQSRIRQHLKDVRLMLDQAAAHGQPLPLSETHAALMAAAVAAGDGDLDNAALVREWGRRAVTPPVMAPATSAPPPATGRASTGSGPASGPE